MRRLRDAAALAVALPLIALLSPLALLMERFCDPSVPWEERASNVDAPEAGWRL